MDGRRLRGNIVNCLTRLRRSRARDVDVLSGVRGKMTDGVVFFQRSGSV